MSCRHLSSLRTREDALSEGYGNIGRRAPSKSDKGPTISGELRLSGRANFAPLLAPRVIENGKRGDARRPVRVAGVPPARRTVLSPCKLGFPGFVRAAKLVFCSWNKMCSQPAPNCSRSVCVPVINCLKYGGSLKRRRRRRRES